MFFFLVTLSCNTALKLEGNRFIYKSKKRRLQFTFKNDSLCILKNVFYCPDIDPAFKVINIDCSYIKKGDTVFLKNLNPKQAGDLYLYIPPQKSNCCKFLNKENRQRTFSIGPNYHTDYEEYGLVPNITNDTLFIVKKKIYFFKRNQRESIGFIFK